MIVKICGITNREDALVAVEAGASAIGFNFYRESPRYLSLREASAITDTKACSALRRGCSSQSGK